MSVKLQHIPWICTVTCSLSVSLKILWNSTVWHTKLFTIQLTVEVGEMWVGIAWDAEATITLLNQAVLDTSLSNFWSWKCILSQLYLVYMANGVFPFYKTILHIKFNNKVNWKNNKCSSIVVSPILSLWISKDIIWRTTIALPTHKYFPYHFIIFVAKNIPNWLNHKENTLSCQPQHVQK